MKVILSLYAFLCLCALFIMTYTMLLHFNLVESFVQVTYWRCPVCGDGEVMVEYTYLHGEVTREEYFHEDQVRVKPCAWKQ